MKRWIVLPLLLVMLAGCTPTKQSWAVTVDGTDLPGGSIVMDHVIYVNAQDMADALGLELERSQSVTIDGITWLPLMQICQDLQLSVLEDPENRRYYCTSGILDLEIPEGCVVPVLMYHGISDEPWGDANMFLGTADMEAHLKYLTENGYDCITFKDLCHVEQYDKPIILTFDDGYVCNYTTLYPLLQTYNVKATINIVTSSIGSRETSMTAAQVRELADSGLICIQSHTVSHKSLTDLSIEALEHEIVQSKLEVARLTGREPFALCYPCGEYDETVMEMVAKHYRIGIATRGLLYETGSDPMQIPRFSVYRGMTAEALAELLKSVEY